jgi:four helix bundle suffix protein
MKTLKYTGNKIQRPAYEHLARYQLGLVIQELTEQFTVRWIKSYRRQSQMDEAARSIPQNVAESHTQESLKGYIKLSGIARGSNEELSRDCLNFLKKNNLPIWDKNHPKVREFRAIWLNQNSLNTPNLPKDKCKVANMIHTFCQMEGYLLKRLIDSLKNKHKTEGGFTEKLYRTRKTYRGY